MYLHSCSGSGSVALLGSYIHPVLSVLLRTLSLTALLAFRTDLSNSYIYIHISLIHAFVIPIWNQEITPVGGKAKYGH